MIRTTTKLALLVAPLLLLLAACGGGSGSPTATIAVPTPTGTPGDPASTDAFGKLASKFADLEGYRGVYDVKVDNGQGGGFSARMTFVQKGTSTRTELQGTSGSTQADITTIYDGKHLYICQSNTCQEAASGAQFQDPLSTYAPARIVAQVVASGAVTVHPAAGQTIAGIEAKCFLLFEGTAQSTLCFDPGTGILLSLDGAVDQQGKTATTTIHAREASAKVDSIDLKPPYKVVEATPAAS